MVVAWVTAPNERGCSSPEPSRALSRTQALPPPVGHSAPHRRPGLALWLCKERTWGHAMRSARGVARRAFKQLGKLRGVLLGARTPAPHTTSALLSHTRRRIPGAPSSALPVHVIKVPNLLFALQSRFQFFNNKRTNTLSEQSSTSDVGRLGAARSRGLCGT